MVLLSGVDLVDGTVSLHFQSLLLMQTLVEYCTSRGIGICLTVNFMLLSKCIIMLPNLINSQCLMSSLTCHIVTASEKLQCQIG